ncbi:hypothetical protein Pyn_20941 [Prunus yedoensis var. nudiflora]|uniref:Uncharacterized protein n=1 Tax=Prunus yedoensis var. nudiflora TaxID=2094558 RepID=A0A314UB85_PRUYE|nr:hypothetical protein Pyn_20941 [Prunus yedoensis var. nudiflora]
MLGASGGVLETEFTGGVGGERKEEEIKIEFVGAVGSETSFVRRTEVVVVFNFTQTAKAKQAKHKGHQHTGIE